MDASKREIAQVCLGGAYDASLSFPESVRMLIDAGFEGYLVDYRLNTRTHYLPDGECLVLENPRKEGTVSPTFDKASIAAAIKWAQANPPDYSYAKFNERVMSSGCAGYFVSFTGRRVVYFGRTAELHVEHFPQ
jgi:uncharacterized protein YbcV (DUF1398 family)